MIIKKKIILLICIIVSIPIISSEDVAYDNPNLPRVFKPEPITTTSDGGNSSFNQSLTDLLYLKLDGSNANQNIDIGNYDLSVGGDLNLLTDTKGLVLGSGSDAKVYVDGVGNFILNSRNNGVSDFNLAGGSVVPTVTLSQNLGSITKYWNYGYLSNLFLSGTSNSITTAGDISITADNKMIKMGDGGSTDYSQKYDGSYAMFNSSGGYKFNTNDEFLINRERNDAKLIINANNNNNMTYLYLLEGLNASYSLYKKNGIYLKYNGGTNDFSIGNVQANVETDSFYIDRDTGNIGVGTATSPNKVLHSSWVSTDTAVTSGDGLSGGAAGKGVLLQNTASTINSYANLDLRAGSSDGRIAYQNRDINNGDFQFITDNGAFPIVVFTMENEGAIRQPTDTLFYQGGAGDVSFGYNVTDWVFNPNVVGTGKGWLLNDWKVTGGLDVSGNVTGNQYYGEMWNKTTGGFETVDLVTTDVYVPIKGLICGENNGINCVNGTGNLTILKEGVYLVIFMASIDKGAVSEYETKLFVNNIGYDKCYSHFDTIVTMGGSPSFNCIIEFSVGDIVQIKVEDHVNPVNDPKIENLNLNLLRVGNI